MTDPSELALASDTAIRLQNESTADRECAIAELQLRLPSTGKDSARETRKAEFAHPCPLKELLE